MDGSVEGHGRIGRHWRKGFVAASIVAVVVMMARAAVGTVDGHGRKDDIGERGSL